MIFEALLTRRTKIVQFFSAFQFAVSREQPRDVIFSATNRILLKLQMKKQHFNGLK
jgi:hypothetical protein